MRYGPSKTRTNDTAPTTSEPDIEPMHRLDLDPLARAPHASGAVSVPVTDDDAAAHVHEAADNRTADDLVTIISPPPISVRFRRLWRDERVVRSAAVAFHGGRRFGSGAGRAH
jgi:hypothetical protein